MPPIANEGTMRRNDGRICECSKGVEQMARELGVSVWTVREHIQRLYRHFGVGGRDELMARFVSR
jgi:DNA-binding NarL/FixJ family response regulator